MFNLSQGFNSIVCHETRSTFFRSRFWTLVCAPMASYVRSYACIHLLVSTTNSCTYRFATTIFNYKSKWLTMHTFLSLFHSVDRLFPQFYISTTLLHFVSAEKRDTFLWWREKKLWFRLDLVHLNTINVVVVVVVLRSQKRKIGTNKMCLIWADMILAERNKSKEYATKAKAKWKTRTTASQPSTFSTYYIVITPNGFLFRNTPISQSYIVRQLIEQE